MAQLTRKQIYSMRGKLKAPSRAAAMVKRYEDKKRKYETQYQKDLAKRLMDFVI